MRVRGRREGQSYTKALNLIRWRGSGTFMNLDLAKLEGEEEGQS